jgi:hypothetical protein
MPRASPNRVIVIALHRTERGTATAAATSGVDPSGIFRSG